MITKTIAILLSMSLSFLYDSTYAPTIISVDIEFCDQIKTFEKSICTIQESENKSNNQLIIDQNGEINDIIIDRRSITSEKAKAIFGNGSIMIEHKSIIEVPYLRKSILIPPGEYKVTQLRRGYKIQIRQ
ncbi:MAG: hypothetical protein AAGA77_11235 [Bacteroidota bacterium]